MTKLAASLTKVRRYMGNVVVHPETPDWRRTCQLGPLLVVAVEIGPHV